MSKCSIRIQDIGQPSPCEDMRSGVRRLLYIPVEHTERIAALRAANAETFEEYIEIGSTAMTEQAVRVKEGCEFGSLRLYEGMGELKYSLVGQHGTRCFLAHLEVKNPVFRRQMLGFMAALSNTELYIFCELENGEWHLLGNSGRGCRLADGTEGTSGKAITDEAGCQLVFEIYTPLPKMMFEGWQPEHPVYGVEMYRVAYLLSDEAMEYVITTEDGYALLLIEKENL